MREILFRGKTACGAWVQGDLIHRKIWQSEFEVIRVDDSGFDNYQEYEVATDTIGQYTGLTDKNGKKIFEGDILAFSDRLVYVHWHDYCGCWDCSYIKAIEGKPTLHEDRSPNKWRYNAEVIGNIHDNKELLEVK